jgi:hypothetical protein
VPCSLDGIVHESVNNRESVNMMFIATEHGRMANGRLVKITVSPDSGRYVYKCFFLMLRERRRGSKDMHAGRKQHSKTPHKEKKNKHIY